jgi:hypothetical protein
MRKMLLKRCLPLGVVFVIAALSAPDRAAFATEVPKNQCPTYAPYVCCGQCTPNPAVCPASGCQA